MISKLYIITLKIRSSIISLQFPPRPQQGADPSCQDQCSQEPGSQGHTGTNYAWNVQYVKKKILKWLTLIYIFFYLSCWVSVDFVYNLGQVASKAGPSSASANSKSTSVWNNNNNNKSQTYKKQHQRKGMQIFLL